MAMLAPSETWQQNPTPSPSPPPSSPPSLDDLDDVVSSRSQQQLNLTVDRLLARGHAVDVDTYLSILARIADARALAQGRRVHAFVATFGCGDCQELVLGNVIRMYGCCGSVAEARDLFDSMSGKGQFAWNTMLVVYTQNGHHNLGTMLHRRMPLHNVVSWNTLMVCFFRHGWIDDARRLFDAMPDRSVMSWNTLVTQYAENRLFAEARAIFRSMLLHGVAPSAISFLGVLASCEGRRSLGFGRMLHALIVVAGQDSNVRVASAIVSMYGKCGSIGNARSAFDELPNRNRVTWNGMLAAYAQNGHSIEALEFLAAMRRAGIAPNRITFLSALESCSNLSAIDTGREIHSSIRRSGLASNPKIVSALITMYGKCGDLALAQQVFDESASSGDAIAWTSLIAAYARQGRPRDAIALLPRMDLHGIATDKVTFASILDAIASASDELLGRSIHSLIQDEEEDRDRGIQDVFLATSLMGMYGRCGSLDRARAIFLALADRDAFAWNAIVAVHSHNGDPRGALELFHLMELDGVPPSRLTVACALTAFAHTGHLLGARDLFLGMGERYGVAAGAEHYYFMVDALARVGEVELAEELVEDMPFEAEVFAWTALLNACREQRNAEVGVRASRRVGEMLPKSLCAHVMLRNVLFQQQEDSWDAQNMLENVRNISD